MHMNIKFMETRQIVTCWRNRYKISECMHRPCPHVSMLMSALAQSEVVSKCSLTELLVRVIALFDAPR